MHVLQAKLRLHSKFFLISYIFDDYYKYILSISFPSVLAYWFLSWYFSSLYNWIITWFIKLNSNKTNPPKNPPGTKHVCWLLTTQCYTICCLLELSRFYLTGKLHEMKSNSKEKTGNQWRKITLGLTLVFFSSRSYISIGHRVTGYKTWIYKSTCTVPGRENVLGLTSLIYTQGSTQ